MRLNHSIAALPALFVMSLLVPLGGPAQEIPANFQAAEQNPVNPTPPLPPGNYNILNINTSTGSRASASTVISNTFGVTSEASATPQAQTSAVAIMGIKDNSSVTNSLGGDARYLEFNSAAETSGNLSIISSPDQSSSLTSSVTTTIIGASTVGSINMAETSGNCDEICQTGSRYVTESAASSQEVHTKTSGSARGFLNTSVGAETQQSTFTNVFYNSF